ncbi:MAG: amidohydrolase [Planctomycetota bacterium]|jgi:predicted amidohydrolase YtcJ|nr:amidohydrolase [Planctomycetota bacterium]
MPDILFTNGRFTTLDPQKPYADAVAVRDGRFLAVGSAEEVARKAEPGAATVDCKGRLLVPGLHDSHLHLIRGGLNYNMELRWDGVSSLSEAMRMLKAQVDVTPAPQWVRVVGGFTLHQFAEKRLPTIEELNAIAPDTPVFILHLYDRAILNAAALRAVGYTKDTQNPPGGEIVRDARGNPTGMLVAKPNAGILYATLAKGPKLSPDDQEISTRLFMRELNRLGVTSCIDAGGGFQNYPEDYAIIEKLAKNGELTVRIAYNLFTQNPGGELQDFEKWTASLRPLSGTDMYRHNGGGEMLVFSAADFEDFRQVRPDVPSNMEGELERVVRTLAEKRWPFRLHATYDETITRALNVFEKVNKDVPFNGIHWFFDHAETISPANIDRVRALGGGIAIQDRMAFQGEFFAERYGQPAAEHTPPIRRMLAAGVPVGAGTDATRVSSYNPWVCLCWMVTGKTFAGMPLYGEDNLLDRAEALRLYTEGSAWFSNDAGGKGVIREGQLADFVAPSADYFRIPADDIKFLSSHLTVVGGKVVYAAGEFRDMAPPELKVSPDWSPVKRFPGYVIERDIQDAARTAMAGAACGCGCGGNAHAHAHAASWVKRIPFGDENLFWDSLGCACWM